MKITKNVKVVKKMVEVETEEVTGINLPLTFEQLAFLQIILAKCGGDPSTVRGFQSQISNLLKDNGFDSYFNANTPDYCSSSEFVTADSRLLFNGYANHHFFKQQVARNKAAAESSYKFDYS